MGHWKDIKRLYFRYFNVRPIRNFIVFSTTLLFAFVAWLSNIEPFYYGTKASAWGVISTCLFLTVWATWMLTLKHLNPFLNFALIFHSLSLWVIAKEMLRLWFNLEFSLLDFIVRFLLAVYYGPISYLQEPYSNIAWAFVIILQEFICVCLFIRKCQAKWRR